MKIILSEFSYKGTPMAMPVHTLEDGSKRLPAHYDGRLMYVSELEYANLKQRFQKENKKPWYKIW